MCFRISLRPTDKQTETDISKGCFATKTTVKPWNSACILYQCKLCLNSNIKTLSSCKIFIIHIMFTLAWPFIHLLSSPLNYFTHAFHISKEEKNPGRPVQHPTYNFPLLNIVEEDEVAEHGDEREEAQSRHDIDHRVLQVKLSW